MRLGARVVEGGFCCAFDCCSLDGMFCFSLFTSATICIIIEPLLAVITNLICITLTVKILLNLLPIERRQIVTVSSGMSPLS